MAAFDAIQTWDDRMTIKQLQNHKVWMVAYTKSFLHTLQYHIKEGTEWISVTVPARDNQCEPCSGKIGLNACAQIVNRD